MISKILENVKTSMDGAIQALKKDLNGIRTGRASPNLLDSVVVDSYGQKMPLKNVANISVPEPKMILVQVWDRDAMKNAAKAIVDSGLGLNPIVEGQVIRIVLPDLTEERRKELIKVVGKHAEKSRIAIRNIRRDGIDELKKLEKAKEISEDDTKRYSNDIQKFTDDFNKVVDKIIEEKEKELMKI